MCVCVCVFVMRAYVSYARVCFVYLPRMFFVYVRERACTSLHVVYFYSTDTFSWSKRVHRYTHRLRCVEENCRVLQSVDECWRVLQSVQTISQCYRVLQCALVKTHFLGPHITATLLFKALKMRSKEFLHHNVVVPSYSHYHLQMSWCECVCVCVCHHAHIYESCCTYTFHPHYH